MSYKSPIEIIYGEMTHKLENEVFTAVQNIGINVDKDDTCFLDIKDTVEEVIALLKAKDTNVPTKWISVKDRLPEVDNPVIVYACGKNDPIYKIIITSMGNLFDVHIKTKPYWREPWQFFDTMYEITHWMPLPEPPKEEA